MRLTLRTVGHLHDPQRTPADHANKWAVEPVKEKTFILGFNVGRTNPTPYFRINGRKDNYRTLDEALAVLQKESEAA